jgi:mRNA interferase RelE/StbE
LSYKLVYTYRAIKDIGKLDKAVKQRIGATLVKYQNEPTKFARRLTASAMGSYRFRIGDYRVIFDLEGSDIVVLRIGHRRNIYKK